MQNALFRLKQQGAEGAGFRLSGEMCALIQTFVSFAVVNRERWWQRRRAGGMSDVEWRTRRQGCQRNCCRFDRNHSWLPSSVVSAPPHFFFGAVRWSQITSDKTRALMADIILALMHACVMPQLEELVQLTLAEAEHAMRRGNEAEATTQMLKQHACTLEKELTTLRDTSAAAAALAVEQAHAREKEDAEQEKERAVLERLCEDLRDKARQAEHEREEERGQLVKLCAELQGKREALEAQVLALQGQCDRQLLQLSLPQPQEQAELEEQAEKSDGPQSEQTRQAPRAIPKTLLICARGGPQWQVGSRRPPAYPKSHSMATPSSAHVDGVMSPHSAEAHTPHHGMKLFPVPTVNSSTTSPGAPVSVAISSSQPVCLLRIKDDRLATYDRARAIWFRECECGHRGQSALDWRRRFLCSCEKFKWLAACRTCHANGLKITRLLQHQSPPDTLIVGTGGTEEPCWLISSLKVQTPNRASAYASFVSFCAAHTCTNNGAMQADCFSALRTIQSDH